MGKPRQHPGWWRGFFRLLTFILGTVIAVSFSGPVAQAAARLSVGQTYYDLQIITPGGNDRLKGQTLSAVIPGKVVDTGLAVEIMRLRAGGGRDDFYTAGFVVEKQLLRGTLAGMSAGLMQVYANGSYVTLCTLWEIYGKATIITAGRGELRGFVGSRWVSPTPWGALEVVRFGLEVSAGL